MTKKNNNVERVYDLMQRESVNGVFSGSFNYIAKKLGFKNAPTSQYSIKKLIEQGLVEIIVPPTRGRNQAEYKVLHKGHTDVNIIEEIVVFIKGVELKLVYVQGLGYCLSKENLASIFTNDSMVSIEEYKELIDLKVKRNHEQFVSNMAIVDGQQYFNRDAVLLYLSKLDLDNASNGKRELLNEFQQLVVSKMCNLIFNGTVTIDEDEKVKLQTNLANLCDLDKNQVKDFLEDIQGQFQDIINDKSREVEQLKKQVKKCEGLIEIEQARARQFQSQMVQSRLSN